MPFGVDMFHPFQTIVEVESINIKSNSLLIHTPTLKYKPLQERLKLYKKV